MTTPLATLRFLSDAHARGEAAALIALTGIDGSAARGLGTLMAVSAGGAWCGSLSGGCVETALVAEAQRVMASGRAEQLRIGAGSPLIDIRLPCGSGLDLLFLPAPDPAVIARALDLLAARQPVALWLGHHGALSVQPATDTQQTGGAADHFLLRIDPPLRLVILGHGEEVCALAALASGWGAEVCVLSPDQRIIAAVQPFGQAVLLKTPGRNPALLSDRWTAVVALFHDHDWETALLAQAAEQPAVFIGAMGSRRTQENRMAALADAGVSEAARRRIIGPIGLIPATRDPQSLALSVLAEVVAAYNSRA